MFKHKLIAGFTIVELLIVIVVIAVLATLSFLAFSNVTQKATTSSLQADITANIKQLKLYQAEFSSFPLTFDANNCPLTAVASTRYCLKFSSGNSLLSYQAGVDYFALLGTNTSNGQVARGASAGGALPASSTRASCLEILNAGESSGDGVYWIKPGVAPSAIPSILRYDYQRWWLGDCHSA